MKRREGTLGYRMPTAWTLLSLSLSSAGGRAFEHVSTCNLGRTQPHAQVYLEAGLLEEPLGDGVDIFKEKNADLRGGVGLEAAVLDGA